MFNHGFFTRILFNRTQSGEEPVTEWRSSVQADGSSSASFNRRRSMTSNVDAEGFGTAMLSRVFSMLATAEGNGLVAIDYTNPDAPTKYILRVMSGSALGESYSSQPSIYGVNTEFLKFVGLTLHAGDELVIDMDNMTVRLNDVNVIQYVSDDSTFFKLHTNDQIQYQGNGTIGYAIQWKDRWY